MTFNRFKYNFLLLSETSDIARDIPDEICTIDDIKDMIESFEFFINGNRSIFASHIKGLAKSTGIIISYIFYDYICIGEMPELNAPLMHSMVIPEL